MFLDFNENKCSIPIGHAIHPVFSKFYDFNKIKSFPPSG